MQQLELELYKARFISEGHNRFIALVEFQGHIIECYVPSSSKLAHFINLTNKEILISKNKVARRTAFTLFAVSYYNKYIMLNLNLINKLLLKYINSNENSNTYYLEKTFNNYKSDILLMDLNNNATIIEAKGIIGTKREVYFPCNSSDRAIEQLKQIKEFLLAGIKIEYYLISLSPIIKTIILNQEYSTYVKMLLECISLGLLVKPITFEYSLEDNCVYERKLKILF